MRPPTPKPIYVVIAGKVRFASIADAITQERDSPRLSVPALFLKWRYATTGGAPWAKKNKTERAGEGGIRYRPPTLSSKPKPLLLVRLFAYDAEAVVGDDCLHTENLIVAGEHDAHRVRAVSSQLVPSSSGAPLDAEVKALGKVFVEAFDLRTINGRPHFDLHPGFRSRLRGLPVSICHCHS